MKKPIILYSTIAFATTWAIAFGIVTARQQGLLPPLQCNLIHSLAAVGPALAATIAIWVHYGKGGLRRFGSKLVFRFSNRYAWGVALSPLLLFVLALPVYRLLKGAWFDFGQFAASEWDSTMTFLAWVLPLFSYGIFEEIGWRGFLLPHLQERHSAWKATVYLTIIWAIWHLPFFFYRFEFSLFISIGFFFGLLVGSLLLSSIYNSGRGALLPVMVFHFTNNLASAFDKEIIVAVLSTGFVFLAISVYKRYGPENLAAEPRTKNYFSN